MSNLFGKAKNLAGQALNTLLFARKESDGSDMQPDSSNNSQRPYKFFNSKNNRSDHPANGSTRPSIKSATPLLKTPRLSNPEKDRICPNCKHQCHSMKCSRCGTFSHEPRVSPLTGSSYKPIAKRTQAMAEKAAARMAQVDVLLSDDDDDDDDEEPITVPTTSNGSIFVPTSEVTITPVREHVALMGQPLFVGSMAGSGNVIVTGDEISLKSLALKNATKPEKYNITIPISDCHVFWYHGPVTSHLDRAMFVFIKPSLKAAKDVMKTLAIPVTEWEEYRLDPKDPEEKYSYVAFKTPLNPSLKANLMAFPEQRVTAWKRARATELYSRIRETNEQLPKLKSQLEGIRSLHKDRFDLMKELELPSTSGIRTPVRSYAGGVRKSVVPRNPEVIDLDADELGLMAVRNGAVTPSPKRQCRSKSGSPDADDDTVMAVYPPNSSHPVTVLKADLKCLEEGEYLNDNILDFYLNYIVNHSNIISEEVRKKTLLFNTFFFNKLTSKGKPGEVDVGRDKHHQKVKKWLRHDDIFSKDFLIVPVNRSKHWFLLIVCYPSNVPACVDVDFGRDPESPCIILMDSLGAVRNGGRNKLTDPLRSLLQAEWKEKRGTEKVFDSEGIPDRRIRVTVQDNYYDCGLYLLQYVEQFLKNPPAILASESNDFKDWVDRKVMSDKREKIKDIIWRMSRIQNATKAKQETSTKLEEVSEGEDEVREQVMQDVEIDPQEKMEEEEDEISEVKEEQID